MNRDQLHALVNYAYLQGRAELQALAAHWDIAGNWNDEVSTDEWFRVLHDFIEDSEQELTAP